MLKSLQIKDYALIENIFVEFDKGLNIITGETGAGKSILLDAMSLLLGERASVESIRKGADKSVVEGIFEASNNRKIIEFLKHNKIDFSDELIVRREISNKGSNRCFINDTPVNLNLIKEIGSFLVDLHGQHEHQSLLKSETHIEALDEYAGTNNLLEDFKRLLNQVTKEGAELKSIKEKESIIKEKKDLYSFQIKEIDKFSPQEGEEEKLLEELKILENSEKLLELTNLVYNLLYESDGSVQEILGKIRGGIKELREIDKSFEDANEELNSVLTLINDIAVFVRNYKDKIELDPSRLEAARNRISEYNSMKKKYGGSVKALLEHRKKIGEEFNLAENFTEQISIKTENLNTLRIECGLKAKELSEKRKEAVLKLAPEIEKILMNLGIQNATFNVKFINESVSSELENHLIVENKKVKYNRSGIDDVEFFISLNAGEDVKPLIKVASGGEISRIMLSLKTILAKSEKLPLLIFDEIDVGVSGRIAQKVGEALKSLASYHQIIAITHLPQIAGLADTHYLVEKKETDGRTVSAIRKLINDERIKEVAKLISGENITEASLKGAKELIR